VTDLYTSCALLQSAPYDAFLSLSFLEAIEEARAVKTALEKRGLRVFLCNMPEGESMQREVEYALHHSTLFVIFGTKTYGKETGSVVCTYVELANIIENKYNFFLIRMCDVYDEDTAKTHLHPDIMAAMWTPKTAMPFDLIDKIMQRFRVRTLCYFSCYVVVIFAYVALIQ
jgi:hypothetical protein